MDLVKLENCTLINNNKSKKLHILTKLFKNKKTISQRYTMVYL